MAFMIPTSLTRLTNTTAGERKLFTLFRNTLPDSCVVRYEMLIGERDHRPDYTLIDPNRGILILEVKDWGVERITRATKERFYIRGFRGSSFSKPVLNPYLKCQIYLREAREQLVSMSILRGKRGRLSMPVDFLIAFPNMTRQEFVLRQLERLIPLKRILFREDLTHETFVTQYGKVQPERRKALDEEQIRAIISALFTDIVISSTATSDDHWVLGEKTYPIDREQEQIAKSLGEGPRLLRGIAGTGKTLIMLYRAKLLAANDRTGKLRILILCWNVSLANYMRQLYDRLQIKADRGQVEIKHFSSFAGKFLQRRIEYEEFDQPAFVKSLEAVPVSNDQMYDAIYIDEAQDFRREWIQFLFHHLLKGRDAKERNLLIAADDAQRIYLRRDFSWSELVTSEDSAPRLYEGGQFSWAKIGIPMQGRTKVLKTIYRNSARVWIFAAYLLEEEASYSKQTETQVRFSTKGGYDPELIECPTPEAQIEEAVQLIQRMIQSNYAARNVLILYRHSKFAGFDWSGHLQNKLRTANLPYESINENKRTFNWQADSIKISTVHSAKGMDSPVVIILGAETYIDRYEDQDETKLMYVALTRAREYLVIFHTGNEGLVPQLKHCQKQYLTYRDSIMGHIEKSA